MGTAWRRGEAVQHRPSTRWVGESGVRSAGCGLQRLQALEQPVVLGVRQLGRVQHVAVRVVMQRGRSCAASAAPRPAFIGSQGPVAIS
jgi:hypothetical protein